MWLCDLIPHSCLNKSQVQAIIREYNPLIEEYNLPEITIPKITNCHVDSQRISEILIELELSKATTIILLGDQPIKYFLSAFNKQYKKLSDFEEYGKKVKISINNIDYDIIALAHPRQTKKLGLHSKKWYETHRKWMVN